MSFLRNESEYESNLINKIKADNEVPDSPLR